MSRAIIFDVDGTLSETEKTAAYTAMVSSGEVQLRPGIRDLIDDAKAQGFRLAIATTTTPANVDALLDVVTPGIYTASHDFSEAALVIDDLAGCDSRKIYALTSPAE